MLDYPDTLSADETMALLRVSRTTLYRLRQRGVIEPVEKPSVVKKQVPLRFRRADVERLAQPIQRAG